MHLALLSTVRRSHRLRWAIFFMRKAFNFFAAYYQTALELNSKDRLAFYDALIHYELTGDKSKLQQLTGLAKFAYKSQEYSIDAQIKGYLDVCKRHDTKAFSECLEPPSLPPTVGATIPPSLQEQEEVQGEGEEEVEEQVYREFKHLKITNSEFLKLLDAGYTKSKIDEILDGIENKKDNKKYVSLYLTALNWLKNDREWNKSKPQKTQPVQNPVSGGYDTLAKQGINDFCV